MTGIGRSRGWTLLFAVLAIVLPVLLALSAWRLYRTFTDQKAVYLRSQVSMVAARLEALPQGVAEDQFLDAFDAGDAGVSAITILDRASTPPEAQGLWNGEELFHTESILVGGDPVYRAYIPFHGPQGALRIARIDVREDAADFLTDHPKHHLWLVALGGALIITLFVLTTRLAARAVLAEKRQLELEHLARIGSMSATLAHEIRNPLGTIKGFAQLLAEKAPEPQAALIQPILSETNRLEQLVKDLLLYGRPADPVLRLVHSRDVAVLVEQHALRLTADSGVVFDAGVSPFELETDLSLLEQVLLNFLRNAFEAVQTQNGGRIRLEGWQHELNAVFRLVDNGPGLSAEAKRRLFEPFFTTKSSGTGLGLSICVRLAERLGGSVKIAPRAEGGVAAEIHLPVKNPGRNN